MNRLKRPDIKRSDQYELRLDENFLRILENSILNEVYRMREMVEAHNSCRLDLVESCRVVDDGKPRDCSEDLMYLSGQLAEVYDFLTQVRWLLTRQGEYSYHQEAISVLADIKREVSYREAVGAASTGTMPRVVTIPPEDVRSNVGEAFQDGQNTPVRIKDNPQA